MGLFRIPLVEYYGGIPGQRQSLIDVTQPHRPDIEETLASRVWQQDRGVKYRIPTLETALANKYGAMLASDRDPGKRLQDAADFTKIVQHSLEEGQQPIDVEKLYALGEKVWRGGGGKEILRLVERIKQGGIVDLIALPKE